MRLRRMMLIGAAMAIFFFLTAGPGTAQSMKIGVLLPFKTPAGEDISNGARMAAEEINAQGGIMGQKLELVLANDEFKPEKGVMAYKKLLLDDKCEVVFGTASSGVAKAVMDQMVRFPAIFISTGGASEALSELYSKEPKKYKHWFRVTHTSVEQSEQFLDFIYNLPVKKMGAKRMAIMAENALWTRGMVADAEKFFKNKGLDTVFSEFFDTETKDFTPILTKILNAKADFIYEMSAHVDGSIFIKQWHDLKGPMIGGASGAGTSDRYWKDCDSKAVSETLIGFGSYPVALTPKTIPFVERYVNKFKISPGYTTTYTYDAFFIYRAAVEKIKSTKPDAVATVMEKTDLEGVNGRWVFDEAHNAKYGEGYRQLPMLQWKKDGGRTVVWPKNLVTGEYELPPWLKK